MLKLLSLSVALLALASIIAPAAAVTDYVFSPPTDKLTARQSSVYHIAQDQHGFMWLATDSDGLLRFDGAESLNWLRIADRGLQRQNVNKFVIQDNGAIWIASWGHGLTYLNASTGKRTSFRANNQSPDALASDRVQTLFLDSTQRLWIGTVAGVNYIDLTEPQVIKRFAAADSQHPLHRNRIWWIAESSDSLWFATSDGLVKLSQTTGQAKQYLLPQPDMTTRERAREVRAVQYFSSGLWASSANGVYRYQQDCDCFARLEMPASVASPRVNVLQQRHDPLLWVGSTEGLFLYDTEANQWLSGRRGFNYLPDVDVRTLYKTDDYQLWVGSRDQGLFIGNPQQRDFSPLSNQLPARLQPAAERLVSALFQDQSDRIWIAAQGSLLFQDPLSNNWQQLNYRQQHNIRKIYQFAGHPDGSVWLATDTGLYRLEHTSLQPELAPFELAGVPPGAITALHIAANGDFYLGVWQRGIIHWQVKSQQASLSLAHLAENSGDQVYQIIENAQGELYVATRYSGLYHQSPASSWQPVAIDVAGVVEGFNCVLPVTDTELWLCSEFGLWRLDRMTGQSTQFLTEHGLPSVYVTGAFFDHQRQLWALTNHGPARFDQQSQRFISYGLNDGLPDLTLQRNAYLLLPDGRFYLGTGRGVATSALNISTLPLSAPKVVLSQVEIDGIDQTRQYPVTQTTITLPAHFRELVLGVSVLDYREPEKNTIQYRLLGLSDKWSAATKNRELRYLGLAPGNYLLEVVGQNSQGIQSAEPLRIKVQVAAPWWYSPYLWVLVVGIFIMLLLTVIYLRELSLRRRNSRLALLVSERTNELEALAEQLRSRAERDGLTALLNRGGFSEQFQRIQQQAARSGQPLSLVLIDLDYFKNINDQFGHEAGDAALQHFAKMLAGRVRATDLVGRWGGEEFILALSNCDTPAAKQFCDSLLYEMKQDLCQYHGQPLPLSATFGIAGLSATNNSLEQAVKLADQALYLGKHQGRARAVIASPQDIINC